MLLYDQYQSDLICYMCERYDEMAGSSHLAFQLISYVELLIKVDPLNIAMAFFCSAHGRTNAVLY